jgi:biopolymer transport protein ExbD
MKVRRGERRRPRIEIIPLIDVTFLLLVFFIYLSLSMSIDRGIPLRLPQTSTAEIQRLHVLEVSVDQHGRIYVERTRVTPEAMTAVLTREVREKGVDRVSLCADREAAYQWVMDALDRIRQAGIEKVTLKARVEE